MLCLYNGQVYAQQTSDQNTNTLARQTVKLAIPQTSIHYQKNMIISIDVLLTCCDVIMMTYYQVGESVETMISSSDKSRSNEYHFHRVSNVIILQLSSSGHHTN